MMNKSEVERLDTLEIEVKNNTGQLEKIIKNDLPHLAEAVAENRGKLKVLIPLIIAILVLVAGIYGVLFLM